MPVPEQYLHLAPELEMEKPLGRRCIVPSTRVGVDSGRRMAHRSLGVSDPQLTWKAWKDTEAVVIIVPSVG